MPDYVTAKVKILNPEDIGGTVGSVGYIGTIGSVASSALPDGAATSAKQLPDGHNVAVASSALPTGAATSAKQLPDGHNVAVASSALPTGAATSTKQDDIITELQETQLSRGGNTVSMSYDIDSHETLKQILTQLQIMNTYLAEWQGECVTTQDI